MSDSGTQEKRIQELQAEVRRLEHQVDALTRSRDEFQEIYTLSLNLLCIADINTTFFLKVNPAFTTKLGYTEEELLSRSFLDFVHPDDVDATAKVVEEKLKVGAKVVNFINRYRCSDGTYLWLDWVSHPLPERGLTFAAAHDISRRKQIEQELVESQSFIRSVMDSLPLGIAVNLVEPVVDFHYMNDNFPKLYRTTREALADSNQFWDAVYEDPKFREQMKKQVLDDCAAGIVERMVWENVPITRKGEETRYISARNTPVPDKGLMISTVWDVTARKLAEDERQKLQEQLLRAQKMESVGRLAGGVAHDFNNMLGVILGRADLILDELETDHPALQGLREIINAAERSAKLTQQLLAFARKQTVTPKILELNAVVEGMLDMLRRLIGENIALTWTPGPDLWHVKMDPGQLDQIMANLCVNARDAITGVGRIAIETENIAYQEDDAYPEQKLWPGDYVCLTVTDSGFGMDADVLEHLFDPFFTTKGPGEGTGLGLSTVYGIVKQNFGAVHVHSELGRGTVFRIYIPRYSRDSLIETDAEPFREISRRATQATILLVEDEPANLSVCTAMLEKLGYRVLPESSPEDAVLLAKSHSEKIDLLITDVIMPEMNGRELADRIVALYPDIRRLFVSGYTADVIAHHGVLEEDVNFLQKPFTRKDLALKVDEILSS